MSVPPRMNFFTLACRDVERMAVFFRELGWPEAPASEPVQRVFQLGNGTVMALYGAHHYVRDYGERADGFRGFTLGINVASMDEVEAIYAALQKVDGVQSCDPVSTAPWGGGFSFRDPEGNIWDVAWAEGTQVGPGGELVWP